MPKVKQIDLWYPRNEDCDRSDDQPQEVEVGLSDVRAADSILISYDFERDGYVIKQASKFSWSEDDPTCDPEWKEVSFIQAWQLSKEE